MATHRAILIGGTGRHGASGKPQGEHGGTGEGPAMHVTPGQPMPFAKVQGGQGGNGGTGAIATYIRRPRPPRALLAIPIRAVLAEICPIQCLKRLLTALPDGGCGMQSRPKTRANAERHSLALTLTDVTTTWAVPVETTDIVDIPAK
ncbi:hypothetical protein HMN09_00375500 [Mycena chlorophos]|uniref:Obg domain-containing protein n=1 Tax=Mycena chlorophos TaxID=658473 RepID=A0A8H6TMZ2_MYCCL|nr:hypothetical protein HMN09_00375500 [Mycena chlorophos]